ncbi:hypothetical protein ZORO111902_12610 [Zobellia roscoffensis]
MVTVAQATDKPKKRIHISLFKGLFTCPIRKRPTIDKIRLQKESEMYWYRLKSIIGLIAPVVNLIDF